MKLDDITDSDVCYLALDGNMYPIRLPQYPDGMPRGERPESFLDSILLRPHSFERFIATLFWVDALRERGRPVPHLVLPHIPGARQDRLNKPDQGDYLFTAKSVAREINLRNFPSVIVLDPHSDVAPALIDRCLVVYPTLPFNFSDYAGIIAPDGGAEKRALKVALAIGRPLYHAWKTRSVSDGKIAGFGHEPLEAGHYLVVDDICDGGGTFLGLADQLPPGVTADLFVTHGLFTQGTDVLCRAYRTVYCTDSTVGLKPGVTIIPQVEQLLLLPHPR